jgi:hypothetical protein
MKSSTTHKTPINNKKIHQILDGFFGESILFLIDGFCSLLTSVEFIDRACLEECFLTGIEWMTCWAGFYTDVIFFGATHRIEGITTRTQNIYFPKIRMNAFLHRRKGLRVGCNRSSSIWVKKVRMPLLIFYGEIRNHNGGPGRDRTYEGISQRIYSPPHLTALEPTHIWSHLSDLNWWPPVYKTDALPTELKWHVGRLYTIELSCQKIFLYWRHDHSIIRLWWAQTFWYCYRRIYQTYTKIRHNQIYQAHFSYE